MKNLLTAFILLWVLVLSGQSSLHFTVTMDQPSTHLYQVRMDIRGFDGPLDLKMPAWTPGYYWLLDLAKNVSGFTAQSGDGRRLDWDKTAKNTWHIETGGAPEVVVTYNVYAFTQSVAHPFLDDGRGFISPTGIFLHPEGHKDHPVTVTIKPYKEWSEISTGLDPVPGRPGTFEAADYDVLYDCPTLVGNQQILSFQVNGIPHAVALENPVDDSFRDKYVSDLKKIVETGSAVIGDIPYKHYTFIIMGRGGGGLEHSNSMAVYSGRNYSLSDAPGYKRWLAFLSHEYFHLYNIKSIRPINLGPFDYDRENLTHMLWVSEGFTVYFEYVIVNQGGLMNREETLEAFTHNITNYEYLPGSRVQSATESSYDTWLQFFNRSDNADNTAISYYDKGCILGLLMDLKIRHETKGKKSLTDVMRTLYRTYFQELKRGFTDDEFREVCEKTAGVSLEEIFRYASTTEPIDYGKYLAYAGMAIDTKPAELPGAFWGATVQERNNNLTVTAIEQGSPAWQSGLSTQDQLLEINGQPATRELLDKTLGAASAGDPITVKVTRRTGEKTITCSLSKKSRPGFRISPLPGATPEQVAIRDQWLAPDRK